MENRTYAIDFDGVIHAYSYGWQDGSAYDSPVVGAIKSINKLVEEGYSVFIFSTRSARQIIKWCRKHSNQIMYMGQQDFMDMYYPMQEFDEALIKQEYDNKDLFQFKVVRVPLWKKFWNKKSVIGVTKRKLPATCYIDDRAVNFNGNWQEIILTIKDFKTYQNG